MTSLSNTNDKICHIPLSRWRERDGVRVDIIMNSPSPAALRPPTIRIFLCRRWLFSQMGCRMATHPVFSDLCKAERDYILSHPRQKDGGISDRGEEIVIIIFSIL